VKLGDFGIARSANRKTLSTNAGGPVLKGKFAYLAPEQVASEGFDQRADLFSTAVVLAEMILGRPLFAGSGQLAVLLAIRDCRIEPLRDARASLPAGLFEVLERALARLPANRFQTAAAFSEALAPFDSNPSAPRAELGALVRWVQSAPSAGQMQAVRDGGAKVRAAAKARDLRRTAIRSARASTHRSRRSSRRRRATAWDRGPSRGWSRPSRQGMWAAPIASSSWAGSPRRSARSPSSLASFRR
jgi:serine/threonine protein kinase